MIECQYCLLKFEEVSVLKKHQLTSKLCIKYKNISFVCNICNFKTVGIKNIENHMCDEVEYEIENDDTIPGKNENENEIEKLKILLSIEKTKNNIYTEIIKQNTNIKLNNILETKEDGLHIYDKKLSIFIYDTVNIKKNVSDRSPTHENKIEDKKEDKEEEDKEEEDKEEDKEDKYNEDTDSVDSNEKTVKKTTYRNFKNILEYRDEIPEDIQSQIISDKKLELQNKIKCDLDADLPVFNSIEDPKGLFKTYINSIKENIRTYSKNLENMKNIKLKLIKYMTYKEYKELLEIHLKTLV